MNITDILGNTRETDRDFPDGSYNCPFCWAAVMGDWPTAANGMRCKNPGCTAGVYATVELAQRFVDVEAKRLREAAERNGNHANAMQRIAEDNERRTKALDAMRTEAAANGYCYDCLRKRNKRVRHRFDCPASRASAYRGLGLRKVKGALGGTYYE